MRVMASPSKTSRVTRAAIGAGVRVFFLLGNISNVTPAPVAAVFIGERMAKYSKYLESEHWQKMRTKALGRAGNKCQLCGNDQGLEVHHNNYDNIGHELPEDLCVLCWRHHKWYHEKQDPIDAETVAFHVAMDRIFGVKL